MNRFDKSCIRAFFTLPPHLLQLTNTYTETLYRKPFSLKLRTANSIEYKETKFFIIWFDHPDTLSEESLIDLSFRDFSYYKIPPVVLIREHRQMK